MKSLLILSIIFSYFLYCFTATTLTVDTLIHKICVVARDKLHIQTATPEERQKVLNSMKANLQHQSHLLGLGSTAHIRLILQGVTILAIEENYEKLCLNKHTNAQRRYIYRSMQETEKQLEKTIIDSTNHSIFNNSLGAQKNNATAIPEQSQNKNEEIQSLMNKIESIINNTMKDYSTVSEKYKIVEKLKDQLKAAFQRVYHDNPNKLDTYNKIVEQSVDQALYKLTDVHTRRSNSESSLIGEEALAEIPHPQGPKSLPKVPTTEQFKQRLANVTLSGLVSVTTPAPPTTTPYFLGVTRDYGCKEILQDTCENLKQIEKFTCDHDGITLNMYQVCDGYTDCPDGSDEKLCVQKVLGKIHVATQLMAKVEMSQNCFKSIIDNSLLSKQGEVLARLLNNQVDFLTKYTKNGLHRAPKPKPGDKVGNNNVLYDRSINEIAYEVAVIVQSFATSLISTLCIDSEKIQKDIDDVMGANLDQEIEEAKMKAMPPWLPSSCECNEQYCATCDLQCKRYCYQIHSLKNFNCRSIKKGQNIISLDFVCDGKLDCLDETDEYNCPKGETSISNSKSNDIFEDIKAKVKSKTLTEEYILARVEMIELQICVQNLQKRSILHQNEVELLKLARNKCFLKLAEIYETLSSENVLSQQGREKIYNFLFLMNENMISALKYSHVGNKNIISSEDCICRGSGCSQVNCPRRCIRICAVKPLLTTYNCSSSPGAVSIPVDNICNGKINCPNAEDELHCKSDICRTHHLKVIRNNIKMLCEKYHGSRVGDVLEKWRTKVTSNLAVMENVERLTPQMYKRTVSKILDDLSLTFGTLEQTRRQELDDTRLQKFYKISQHLVEMVKECNQ